MALLTMEHASRSREQAIQLPDERIQFIEELYEALTGQWLDYIRQLPDDVNRVLLVGHNPWLSMLATGFAGSICELAPCELVAFEFASDTWLALPETGKKILNLK